MHRDFCESAYCFQMLIHSSVVTTDAHVVTMYLEAYLRGFAYS